MFNRYPYTNFHELNLDYFIQHFNEIFTEWEQLYNELQSWKTDTTEELGQWRAEVETDLDEREAALRAELEIWKQDTADDISDWETATLNALDAWKTAVTAQFEAIRVQAAASAEAAAASQTAAETARTQAQAAQTAAEIAAQSVQASAAQIQQNTDDIADLKESVGFTANYNDITSTLNKVRGGFGGAIGEELTLNETTSWQRGNFVPTPGKKYKITITTRTGLSTEQPYIVTVDDNNIILKTLAPIPAHLENVENRDYIVSFDSSDKTVWIKSNYNNNGILLCSEVEINSDIDILENRVNTNTNDIENLKTITGDGIEENIEIDNWMEQMRIALNYNVGQTVDVTPGESSNYNCMNIPVETGEKYIITGTGGSVPRLWGFLDSQNKLISRASDTAVAENLELIAPTDGYLIINVVRNREYHVYKPDSINLTEFSESLESRITNNERNILTALETLNGYYGDSIYYKEIDFGNTSFLGEYYNSLGNDYSFFTRQSLSADVYNKFDELLNAHSNNMSRQNLGNGSDGNPIYSYTFKPAPAVPDYNLPKIIIISAQHGTEKSSVYGMYYLFRDILEKWSESPILDYLKNHVEFLTIPIVNRYGFDNIIYKNANGVNINRNYDTPEFEVGDDPAADSYGGAAPFDQPETRMVRDLVNANSDAFWFLDWHTNGQYKVTSYENINWIAMTAFTQEKYTKKAVETARFHLANITAHLTKDYNFTNIGSQVCGNITINAAHRPTAGRWVKLTKNIIGHTFETNNGFPNEEGSYSQNEQKANAEIMGNWLATIFAVFSKYQTK